MCYEDVTRTTRKSPRPLLRVASHAHLNADRGGVQQAFCVEGHRGERARSMSHGYRIQHHLRTECRAIFVTDRPSSPILIELISFLSTRDR